MGLADDIVRMITASRVNGSWLLALNTRNENGAIVRASIVNLVSFTPICMPFTLLRSFARPGVNAAQIVRSQAVMGRKLALASGYEW